MRLAAVDSIRAPLLMSDELQPNLFDDNLQPVTPYAGSSGWSGSTSSRDRAVLDDTSGVTAERQLLILGMLDDAGADGLTWNEISDITGEHHGKVSGPLSVLHKERYISRLTERRGRSEVYVRHHHVEGRETAPHKQHTKQETENEWLAELLDHIENDRMLSAGVMVREAMKHGIQS
jgi:hypothetical protein